MSITDPLVLEGLLFSGAAFLFVAVSAWYLYLSPMRARVGAVASPSPRLATTLAALLGLAAAQLVVGALWDASMHLKTGIVPGGSDFLWPPHIVIYSSFLIAFLVAGVAIAIIAWRGWSSGSHDPRQWIRRNPYLGAVALASIYSLAAIPGDALWHELFGPDLTAWSPPHVMLGITTATVIICAVGLLAQTRRAEVASRWIDIGAVLLLALMLNVMYIIGVLEWELPVQSPHVLARPIWLYPLVGGSLAFFTFVLAKRLVQWRFSATATALAFYAIRLSISAILGLTGNIAPAVPLLFVLGAVLLDLVYHGRAGLTVQQDLLTAVAFTLGYTLLALPFLSGRTPALRLSNSDLAIALIATLVACSLLFPIARLAGMRLVPESSYEL